MNRAPIALFVYNRPTHTHQTVEALLKNQLSKESDLFIFSDAPKSVAQTDAVREVRQYIRQIDGFKSVTIVERDRNWGLANSIIDGVTRLCNEYGRVIVLEDDLITSPYFLSFMNVALDAYQDEEKVMHISGYMFPIDVTGLPETFFLRTASCWGWATWDRAWEHFSKEPKKLLGEYTAQTINRFNMDGTYNFWAQVEQNESGLINTWAVFWYASVFQVGGLCLHPAISMVSNIGHDDSGEHCKRSHDFSAALASRQIAYFENNIIESALAHDRTRNFFLAIRPSFFQRVFAAIKSRLIV
ncbi:MAG: glycosyltransferase [Sulfurimicrobium sp.]|nr:glycosyltransferase [Sulfurimicrobium sp.]